MKGPFPKVSNGMLTLRQAQAREIAYKRRARLERKRPRSDDRGGPATLTVCGQGEDVVAPPDPVTKGVRV